MKSIDDYASKNFASNMYDWIRDALPEANRVISLDGSILLGSGMSGTAFRVGKGLVVKITRSEQEVDGVLTVLAMRKAGDPLPGFVHLPDRDPVRIGDFSVSGIKKKAGVYVIFKQFVRHFGQDRSALGLVRTIRRGFSEGQAPAEDALEHASNIALDLWQASMTKRERAKDEKEYVAYLLEAAMENPKLGGVVTSMLRVHESTGARVYDVWRGNMGTTTSGKIVAYDWELLRGRRR